MKSRAKEANPNETIGNGEQFWITQGKKKLDIFSLSENEG